MTSDAGPAPAGAYVWVWLPGATTPVVAGRLQRVGRAQSDSVFAFAYGQSYVSRKDAVSLFTPELPLRPGTFDPSQPLDDAREPLTLAGCLRDAAPDAWGRRVINLRLGPNADTELDELTYLLASSSDRIGSLDFHESGTTWEPRGGEATLEQLMEASERVEAGETIPDDLVAAAEHGTSIGGARPKALLKDGTRELIAKFASTTDTRPVVKAEGAAMLLARAVGITVPRAQVVTVAGRDVLLAERFDRTPGGGRRQIISALTILGHSEYSARYSSYTELAEAVAKDFSEPAATLQELYRRLVFNVCIGNNDDHLRNHAAFWDGSALELTPAYDLTPQPRSTNTSTQAIAITGSQRASQLQLCLQAAPSFHLTVTAAQQIHDVIISGIRASWDQAADEALLTKAEREMLMGREILNPYIFYPQP